METRFTKGQTIYQIHTNWHYEFDNTTNTSTTYLKITKEVVESCGQKRLLLFNDSNRNFKQYTPNGHSGFVDHMCKTFHATLEEAEAEVDSYIEYHNNRVYGTRTYLIKRMP